MIVSFRDDWLRDFFVGDIRKIQMLDDAATDRDLRVPPGNHFEKLHGSLEGFHSIRVNKQWRIVFQWDGTRGEAAGVYLDDHSYL
jgi:proteic killer suppression protein